MDWLVIVLIILLLVLIGVFVVLRNKRPSDDD